MSRVFLSHAAADSKAAIALKHWLIEQDPVLSNEIFLDVDRSSGVPVGSRWKDALRQASARCEAVICLVSRYWEESKECLVEYRTAEALGKAIMVVRLEPAADSGVLSEWQRCDLFGDGARTTVVVDGNPPVEFATDGLLRLRNGLRRLGTSAEYFAWPPATDPHRAPYRGWEPYDEVDSAVYFGRDAQIVRGLDALRGIRTSGQNSLLAILGPSGAGKSSFLRAGLLPRLHRDDRRFLCLPPLRPERAALTGERGLAQSIYSMQRGLVSGGVALGHVKNACKQSDFGQLRKWLLEIQGAGMSRFPESADGPPTLVLPIDQGEELFTADAGDESTQFVPLLAELLRNDGGINAPSLIVLLAMRTDRFEALQTAKRFSEIRSVVFDELKPMPPAQFKDVIVGPARRATEAGSRLAIEPELVDQLLAECSDNSVDALPLLSLTLFRLYTDYGDDGDLTLREYRDMGGMRRVVQIEIDSILASDPDERAAQLSVLRNAFIPGLASIDHANDMPIKRIARWADLPSESHALLSAFVDRRLLVQYHRDGEIVLEVAMESLLRQWDALAEWLREERNDLIDAADLERAASEWLKNDRDDAWLLVGRRLAGAESIADKPQFRRRLQGMRTYLEASRREENRHANTNVAPQDESTRDGLIRQFRRLLDSDRFRSYRDEYATITEGFYNALDKLQLRVEASQTSVVDLQQECDELRDAAAGYSPRVRRLRIGAASIAFGVVGTFAALYFLKPGWWSSWVGALLLPVVAILVAVVFRAETTRNQLRSKLRDAERRTANARLAFEQQTEALVEETCTRIINQRLPRGLLTTPTKAPRLVELESSAILPFRSFGYLREFIAGHDASAIGVAGPRGSGKTTLLDALTKDVSLTPYSIMLTAPVHYEAVDFIRRLYLNVAQMIDKGAGEPAVAAQQARADRAALSRAGLALGAVFVGAVLVIPSLVGEKGFLARIDSLGRLGLTVIAVGLMAFCYMLVNRISGPVELRRGLDKSPTAARATKLAAEAIDDLMFTKERSARTKNAFSVFGKAFTMEDEDSLTLKTRELSPADLSNGLRILLRTFAAESGKPVLIAIDELDKISSTDDLIETINGLKDLFRVKGVHFLVSVSTDALRSFERRGLATRDAFDSSFDEIVRVDRLTCDESLELLAARAQGFPEDVGLFCHAWSGGLPRELLRVARSCVHVQRRSSVTLTPTEQMRLVISDELGPQIETELRSDDLAKEHVNFLHGLRQHVHALGTGKSVTQLLSRPADFLCAAVDTAVLGTALIDLFENSDHPDGLPRSQSTYEAVEIVATAMALRTDARALRSKAFDAALMVCRSEFSMTELAEETSSSAGELGA